MMRWISSLAAAAFAAFLATAALAQYPARPIRLLVPNPPGGAIDITARIVGQKLAEALGQPVVVENRAGSNGNIASEMAARAAPDGHTLLLCADSQIVINPHLYSRMPLDTLKDLTPVATLVSTQMVLSVNPSLPVKDFREFVEYARRANPPLLYASIGNGSQHHLAMEMLKARAGIDLVHVPYKGGGPATVAILAGDVPAMFGGNSVSGHIKSGKLRALALASGRRSAGGADLPSIGEFYPGYDVTTWLALFAPAGIPEPVLARVRDEVGKLLALAEVQGKLRAAGGLEPFVTTPEEFASMIRADYAKYGKVVKDSGAKVD